MTLPDSNCSHVVYRMLDANGTLLYVGITLDAAGRFYAHRKDKDWWTQVDTIRVQHFASRAEAIDAERVAIGREKPLHNVREQVTSGPPREGGNTTPTQIRIPEPLKARAKAKAEAEGSNLSKVVIRLLEEYAPEDDLPPPDKQD